MKLTMENVVAYSEYMMREFYRLNREPLFSVMDTHIMWIGSGNFFAFGLTAAEKMFQNGFCMPPIEILNGEFYRLEAGSDTAIVIGRFNGRTIDRPDRVISGCHRLTLHYKRCKKSSRVCLTHIHASNEWHDLFTHERLPIGINSSIYRYVHKLLVEKSVDKRSSKIELCNQVSVQYLDPDLIVYAEAMGAQTIIHFLDKTMTIKRMLGELSNVFPPNFYRPHRGYLINCDYILSLERYTITLVTGALIPIPEKRYQKVREDIMALKKPN